MNPKRKRPIGVTLIALAFLWIGCGGSLFLPIIGLTGGMSSLWRLALGSTIHSGTWLTLVGVVLDCIWFCLYVAYAVIGFGLWKLKNWARNSVLTISAIALTLGLMVCLIWVRPILMAVSVFGCSLFYCGWIAWYLMRPRIRHAFGVWNLATPTGEAIEPPRLSKRGRLTVGVLCVASVFLLLILPLTIAIDNFMRGSDAYKIAMTAAQSSPCIASVLGSPFEAHGTIGGSLSESATSGSAELSIPLHGPKGKGDLVVKGKKLNGNWNINSLVFYHGADQFTLVPADSTRPCQ